MPMPSVLSNAGSEVAADPALDRRRRRSFTAEYKRRILALADACSGHGELAALLRREKLYSSHLSQWQAQRVASETLALTPKTPGRKPKFDAKDRRIVELERDNAKLTHRLAVSEAVVALQKKAQELMAAISAQESTQ